MERRTAEVGMRTGSMKPCRVVDAAQNGYRSTTAIGSKWRGEVSIGRLDWSLGQEPRRPKKK